MIMELIWLGFCGAVAYWANGRGRSPLLWGVLAFFFSPILAGVVLAMLSDKKQEEKIAQTNNESQQIKDRVAINELEMNNRINKVEERVEKIEHNSSPTKEIMKNDVALLNNGTKICPVCGETIKIAAIKCRFCGAGLEEVKMVECPYCKELIRSDAVKCKYCQSEVKERIKVQDSENHTEDINRDVKPDELSKQTDQKAE